MATIIINRTSEYLNRFRDYGVYIDGNKIGTIPNGETEEFNVSAGCHSVFAKIDWCSSQTLSVNMVDQEIKSFKVGGFKNGKWLMRTGVVTIVLSYVANLLFDFEYLFYLVILVFLISVYYITVGRKQYLTLTENKSEHQKTMALP